MTRTTRTSSLRRGFTLIELLVVITIIAALSAMSFAGVNVALKKARKLQGQKDAEALRIAITDYESTYSRLPNVQGNKFQTNNGEGLQLLRILLAEDKEDNARQIKFLTAGEGKGNKGGLIYDNSNTNTVRGMYDPFGNPFTVELNVNYENTMTIRLGNKTYTLRNKNVAVYSPGADKVLGTPDDIRTF